MGVLNTRVALRPCSVSLQQNEPSGRKAMKKLLSPAVLGAATAILMWMPTHSQAQPGPGGGGGGGGRNFDPAQARQMMMDRYKEMLDIKSDDEWKAIEPRVQKVMDARREVGAGMRGMFGRGGRGPGGGAPDAQGDQAQPRRQNFGPPPSVAATDLQKAIESKASTDQIKTKLAAYREDRQQKQANLEKAQEDLKKILNTRQEAAAVLAGLLD
jgi:hypothetical protein